MGTLLGDALARAGVVTKERADQAARLVESDRKRKEIEEIRRKYAAYRAEMQALAEKGLGPGNWEDDEFSV